MASEERLRDASYKATDFDPRAAEGPPARARAVVVGGGIIGASAALHLAGLGWTDTVVLERGRVGGGTSWHAAGLMTRTRGTHAQTELASYSRDFYRDLAALSGVDIGYYPNGSLSLARTPERLTELRYALTLARHHGLPARELSLDEIAAVSPLLSVEGLAGGVLFEEDATLNPGWAAYATAKAAHDFGVRVVEGVRVTGFRLETTARGHARVTAVETDRGDVECEVVVLAAGLWTRELALLAGARVPLHPAEHYWAQTQPIDGATRDLPIVRDLDGSIYVRHYRGGLLVGAFEPDGRPRTEASIPQDFVFGEFEPDLEHFGRPLARARERVPALARGDVLALPVRAGELHARRQLRPRRDRRGGRPLRRRRHELAGHHPRPRGRARPRGVGRRRRAGGGRGRRGRPPVLAGPGQRGLSLRAYPRIPWPALRHALAVPAAGHGRGLRRVPLADRLAAAGAVSARRPAGSAQTGTRLRASGRSTPTPTAARTGSRPSPPSTSRRARTSPSSTSRRSPSCAWRGPAPSPACSVSSPPTSTVRPAPSCTPRCSTRGAAWNSMRR